MTMRARVALRARLAAFLAIAVLMTGLFGLRPIQAPSRGAASPAAIALGIAPASPHGEATRARPELRLGGAQRSRLASRRGMRYEDAAHSARPVAWPDLEMGAPSAPRFVFRKIPSDDGSDADADAPTAPIEGYHSRAPPVVA
jgi:hypothetical protein